MSIEQSVRELTLVNLGFTLCTGIAIGLQVREKPLEARTKPKDRHYSITNVADIETNSG
jgi:hypothetical protein